MSEDIGDARLRELKFLTEMARVRSKQLNMTHQDTTERRMIASLIADGYLNGIDTLTSNYSGGLQEVRFIKAELEVKADAQKWTNFNALLGGQATWLYIGHRGLVRLSELEQQLRSSRQMDPSGILIDKRHLLPALEMALFRVEPERPVTVAFLDMNGLKVINDQGGHALGDEAIRAFFNTIVAGVGPDVEAFRNGGDEVAVILPCPLDAGCDLFGRILTKLRAESITLNGKLRPLAASCGLASTDKPEIGAAALLKLADEQVYRAKEAGKADKTWSALAATNQKVQLIGEKASAK